MLACTKLAAVGSDNLPHVPDAPGALGKSRAQWMAESAAPGGGTGDMCEKSVEAGLLNARLALFPSQVPTFDRQLTDDLAKVANMGVR